MAAGRLNSAPRASQSLGLCSVHDEKQSATALFTPPGSLIGEVVAADPPRGGKTVHRRQDVRDRRVVVVGGVHIDEVEPVGSVPEKGGALGFHQRHLGFEPKAAEIPQGALAVGGRPEAGLFPGLSALILGPVPAGRVAEEVDSHHAPVGATELPEDRCQVGDVASLVHT